MCVILSIVIVDYIQTLSNIVQIFLLKGEYLEKSVQMKLTLYVEFKKYLLTKMDIEFGP